MKQFHHLLLLMRIFVLPILFSSAYGDGIKEMLQISSLPNSLVVVSRGGDVEKVEEHLISSAVALGFIEASRIELLKIQVGRDYLVFTGNQFCSNFMALMMAVKHLDEGRELKFDGETLYFEPLKKTKFYFRGDKNWARDYHYSLLGLFLVKSVLENDRTLFSKLVKVSVNNGSIDSFSFKNDIIRIVGKNIHLSIDKNILVNWFNRGNIQLISSKGKIFLWRIANFPRLKD